MSLLPTDEQLAIERAVSEESARWQKVLAAQIVTPVPMLLFCPHCHARHIDVGEFATKPHHTHACQSCGMCWRPAVVNTVGVQFLPGFKNEPDSA